MNPKPCLLQSEKGAATNKLKPKPQTPNLKMVTEALKAAAELARVRAAPDPEPGRPRDTAGFRDLSSS